MSRRFNRAVVYYDPSPAPMTIQQLDATFAYDPGTFVGGVLPPCNAGCEYFPNAVSVYATTWETTSNSVQFGFSMASFFAADGPGVYTVYVLTGSSTADSVIMYSVFNSR